MHGFSSNFPHGGPGVGLLLLRLAVALQLLSDSGLQAVMPWWQLLLLGLLILLLCLGLLTPVVGAIGMLYQLLQLSSGAAGATALLAIAIATAAALILLGPGAYAVDARLFGRRRLPLPEHAGGEAAVRKHLGE